MGEKMPAVEEVGQTEPKILSVEHFLRSVNGVLDRFINHYPVEYWVEGELCEVKVWKNRFIYCKLKGEVRGEADSPSTAVISAVVYNKYSLSIEPKDGMKVQVQGRVSVHDKTGNFTFVIQEMKEVGLGHFAQNFEKLKEEYRKKGYFDLARKKELPLFPKRVGIITSETGAVIQDIIRNAKKECTMVNLLLYPSIVQGSRAPEEIRLGINYLDLREDIDVIILARGGGSKEDLDCFNSPLVVEAIYHCKTPLVSAVGHEVDTSLADLVADYRCSTPTEAAIHVFPKKKSLLEQLEKLQPLLQKNLQNRYAKDYLKFQNFSLHLQNRIKSYLQKQKEELDYLKQAFSVDTMKLKVESKEKRLREQIYQFQHFFQTYLSKLQNYLDIQKTELENRSPYKIFERGYSRVSRESKTIQTVKGLTVGDIVQIEMKDGEVLCQVLEKNLRKTL